MEEAEDTFNIRHDEWLSRMQTSENKAEVIVAKQRHGPIGAVQVHFEKRFTHFTDLTDASQLPEGF
jgi:replicative DNA helicase